ncbi:MAG: YraN family protein [Pseudomonadota bacterium]
MTGNGRHHAGRAAEEIAERAYAAKGARVIARRWRVAGGEIDLALRDGPLLIIVEVKQRRRDTGADSPVSAAQWRRIATVAERLWTEHPEAHDATGCRFDAAIIGSDGALTIVEDAYRPGFD